MTRAANIGAIAVLIAMVASLSPRAAPVLDYGFFKARVEPIFLEKRPGHVRCYVCHAESNNGFRLERLIEVAEDKPTVRVTSRLTNTTDAAKTTTLRIHPAFQVDSTQAALVRMARADGGWTTQSLADPKEPRAEKSLWLRGDDVPAGNWEIVDETSGVKLRATFKPDEFARTFMYLHKTGAVEGMFLSSGVINGGMHTQDQILATAEILRRKYQFKGYLHLKIMPGAEKAQVEQAMLLADRVSVNLEAPNDHRLQKLAPKKQFLDELMQPFSP